MITLYKKDMNGNVLVWQCEIDDIGVRTSYGRLDSNSLRIRYITKDNTMTHYDQANNAVLAKLREGYVNHEDVLPGISPYFGIMTDVKLIKLKKDLLDNKTTHMGHIVPMKCQPFKDNKMNYPVVGQHKFNGVRATIAWEITTIGTGMFTEKIEGAVCRSKKGLVYYVPHITNCFKYDDFLSSNGELMVYDGELYIHGVALSDIRTHAPLMKNDKIPHTSNNPERLRFVCFDCVISNVPQTERLNELSVNIHLINGFGGDIDRFTSKELKIRHTQLATTANDIIYFDFGIKIINDDHALNVRNIHIAEGFEGVILRDKDALYRAGSRPVTIMKYKMRLSTECEIVDIFRKPNTPNFCMFKLKNDITDATFDCVPIGDESTNIEYMKNRNDYIGKLATIEYYERTVNDLPFNANVIVIRDYE